jgi:ankyrin repeat protein
MATSDVPSKAWNAKLTEEEIQLAPLEHLEEKGNGGGTVLYYSSRNCTLNIVQALVDRGVNINGLSKDDWSPLMGAVNYKRWDNAKLLLERGANAQLYNKDGWSAIQMAVYNNVPIDLLQDLIHHGADVLAKNPNGHNCFEIACDQGHTELASYLEQYITPSKSANIIA